LEIVNRPHAVPDAVGRHIAADEDRADADQRVFGGAAKGGLAVGLEHLCALALADRVVAERSQPVLRKQDAGALIGLGAFAVGAVAARHDHAGVGWRRLREVE